MQNRIRRGFDRIGIGAAVLVALAGLSATGLASFFKYGEVAGRTFMVTVTAPRFLQIDYPGDASASDIRHSIERNLGANAAYSVPTDRPQAAAEATTVATIGIFVTAILAAAAWGFFAGLGWIAAGFGRD